MQKEQNQAAASALVGAGRRTWTMFVGNLPNILAVAFLSGLLLHFLPVHRLTGLLGGGVLADGFVGAVMGSVSTGNPLVGYILAGEFLEQGLGPAVITALLVSWVTVGSVQLPAEIQSFGLRFALLRNGLAFASALLIALLVLPVLRFFGGSLP
jgi:hypothetical protein